MSDRPSIRVHGEIVRAGDSGVASFTDPIGQCVTVGACVHVDRIQLFDPLTGEMDPRLWLRRVGSMEAVNGPDPMQPVWELRRSDMSSFAHCDAPALSQEEFDVQMKHFGMDAEADDAEEDRKMDRLHEVIDNAIERLEEGALYKGSRVDEEVAREILLELVHATPNLV